MHPLEPRDLGIGRLFSAIRDAVIVGDASTGRIVLWNPAAEALFGYSEAEAIGTLIEVLVPEALKAPHRSGLSRYREVGHGHLVDTSVPVELPARRKDGQEITIDLTLGSMGDVEQGGPYVLATIRDATARKQAE